MKTNEVRNEAAAVQVAAEVVTNEATAAADEVKPRRRRTTTTATAAKAKAAAVQVAAEAAERAEAAAAAEATAKAAAADEAKAKATAAAERAAEVAAAEVAEATAAAERAAAEREAEAKKAEREAKKAEREAAKAAEVAAAKKAEATAEAKAEAAAAERAAADEAKATAAEATAKAAAAKKAAAKAEREAERAAADIDKNDITTTEAAALLSAVQVAAEAKAAAAKAEREAAEAEAKATAAEAKAATTAAAAERAEAAAADVYESRRAATSYGREVGRAAEQILHTAAEYTRFIATAVANNQAENYIYQCAVAYYADGHKLDKLENESAKERRARTLRAAAAEVRNNGEVAERVRGYLSSKNKMFKLLREYSRGYFGGLNGNNFTFAKEITCGYIVAETDREILAEAAERDYIEVMLSRDGDNIRILAAPFYADILTSEAANARRVQRTKNYTTAAEAYEYYISGGRVKTLVAADKFTFADIFAAVSRRLQIEDTRAAAVAAAKAEAAKKAAAADESHESRRAEAVAAVEATRAKIATIYENCKDESGAPDLAKFKKAAAAGLQILRRQLAAAGIDEAAEAWLILTAA